MKLQYTVWGTVLIISALVMAGCTVPSPQPVATLSPTVPVATAVSLNPAGTASPATPAAAWTLETPKTGRPYSKLYTFTATGDYDEHTFTTDSDRTWVFRLTYPEQGDFIVVLKDNHGGVREVLARAGESSSGEKSVWLEAGTYALDVQADAPWTITMFTG